MKPFNQIKYSRMNSRMFAAIPISVLVLLFALPALAWGETVEEILKAQEEPAGVVFEVIEGDPEELKWVVPQIRSDVERLRERFPGLSVAVVSHGREEFGLTTESAARLPKVHSLVKDLSENGGVTVHVCATHASWYDVAPEAFPDYVNVSETGPAQINDYLDMGYLKVMVSRYPNQNGDRPRFP